MGGIVVSIALHQGTSQISLGFEVVEKTRLW
jgi:hypothetical protein